MKTVLRKLCSEDFFPIRKASGELVHKRKDKLELVKDFYGVLYHSVVFQFQTEDRADITGKPAATISETDKALID